MLAGGLSRQLEICVNPGRTPCLRSSDSICPGRRLGLMICFEVPGRFSIVSSLIRLYNRGIFYQSRIRSES
jgi:hypothetical protein